MAISFKDLARTLTGKPQDVAVACAIFAIAASIVHQVPSSPFVVNPAQWTSPASSTLIATWFAAATVLAIAVAALFPRRPPAALLFSQRAVLASFLFYVVTAGPPAYGGSDPSTLARLHSLDMARWAAIACGFGALLRPALGLPLLLYVLWFRLEVNALYGLGSDNTDLAAVAYYGLLLVVAGMLVSVVTRLAPRAIESPPANAGDAAAPAAFERNPPAVLYVLLFCTACYLSNYFTSGWGKESLAGPVHAWMLENRTDALIPVSDAMGTFPLAGYGLLSVFVYGLVSRIVPVVNAMTLVVEMSPIVAVTSFRLLAVSCALMVPFHLTIFLLTGIFFWKWAVVDGALSLLFWRLRTVRIPVLVALIAVALVANAPRMLLTSKLAWYDTSALNEAYLVAVAEDGTRARVPSNFFLSESLAMAQMRFGAGLFGRMLATGVYGTSYSYPRAKTANACELEVVYSSGATTPETWENLERFVREHHAYILAHADAAGHYDYDLYPHHIWSNPALYADFSAMDKRRIVDYVFFTDYVCVGYDENGLTRRTLGSDSRTIHIR